TVDHKWLRLKRGPAVLPCKSDELGLGRQKHVPGPGGALEPNANSLNRDEILHPLRACHTFVAIEIDQVYDAIPAAGIMEDFDIERRILQDYAARRCRIDILKHPCGQLAQRRSALLVIRAEQRKSAVDRLAFAELVE